MSKYPEKQFQTESTALKVSITEQEKQKDNDEHLHLPIKIITRQFKTKGALLPALTTFSRKWFSNVLLIK